MFIGKYHLILGLSAGLLLAGCGNGSQSGSASPDALHDSAHQSHSVALDVYKSETCGCCVDWIDHMEDRDFTVTAHHPEDLAREKQRLGVDARHQSCHTAVSPEGYIFEGHIPARLVKEFLQEKPEGAIGLAVPGMPVGSPGMEMGDRFTAYDVLLLKEDGGSEVYASIDSAAEQ